MDETKAVVGKDGDFKAKVPNARTRQAIAEARELRARGARFSTPEELFAALDAEAAG